MNTQRWLLSALALCLAVTAHAKGNPGESEKRFAQLETLLPTPGLTRSASGAPGPQYWQQRADYRIKVSLDEQRRRISGVETITYMNRSPDDHRLPIERKAEA